MRPVIFLIVILFSLKGLSQDLIFDESYKDKSFWLFKNKLENCVINKDVDALKGLLANRVFESNNGCGYGGCSKEDFIKMYFGQDLNEEYKEFVWYEFLTVIRFGFFTKIDNDINHPVEHKELVFEAPSYRKTINRDNSIIVLAENVNIRESPSLNSKVIRTATYEVFDCDCNIMTSKETTFQNIDGIDWLEIKLGNGLVGYIAAKYTSYMISKELTVGKVNGQWKIISYYHPPGC